MISIKHGKDYKLQRAKSYPPIEDFADAMYHAQNGNNELLDEYFAKVREVKERFPKTEKEVSNGTD